MKNFLPYWAALVGLLTAWSFFTCKTLNVSQDAIKGFVVQSFCFRFRLQSVSPFTVTLLWSICGSAHYFGAILGSGIIGITMKRLGRKDASMTANGGLCLMGSSLCLFSRYANSFEMLFVGQFIAGISCAQVTIAVIYMVECAEDKNRGFIGSLCGFLACATSTLCTILGQPAILGNVFFWHYLYLFGIVIGFVSIGFRWILHESPKFAFIDERNEEKARRALWFYQKANEQAIQAQLEEYVREDNLTKQLHTVSWRQIFRERLLRRCFFITFMVIFAEVVGGISFVSMYSTWILESLGLDSAIAATVTAGIYVVALIAKIPFCFYGVENIGRKYPIIVALLVSCAANCLLMTGNSYLCIIGLVLIILANRSVLAMVAYFIPAEVCPQSVRSKITAVSWAANWTFSLVVVLFFGLIYESIHGLVYLFFAVLSLCFAIWFWWYLPETKQKPVDEIVAKLTNEQLVDYDFILDKNNEKHYGSLRKTVN